MAVLKIPVTKAGKSIPIDTDALPEEMFALVVEEGLKLLVNKGLTGSKFATKGLEGEELEKAKEACFERAEKNVEDLLAGKTKRGRTASAGKSKIPGVVMTEARRLAKAVVKDEIRAAGLKISHVEASEITAMANAMIESDPKFIEMAQANIEARSAMVHTATTDEETAAAAKAKLAALGFVGESPKLVAKAEKAKAERKTQLSAKQAGKPAPRKASAQPHA